MNENTQMMFRNKTAWTIVGFLLAGTGLLSIMLSLIGAKLAWLAWLSNFGSLVTFLVHITMMLAGFVILYLSQTNTDEQD
jgi:hypothetical protein